MTPLNKYNWNDIFTYKEGILHWKACSAPRITIGSAAGTLNNTGYIHIIYKYKQYLCHRIIWEMFNGPIPDKMIIDHIDCNKTNNKIENLRIATRNQNNHNRRMQHNNVYNVKGLDYDTHHNKWRGRIAINGKTYMKRSTSKQEIENWLIKQREILHKKFTNHGV